MMTNTYSPSGRRSLLKLIKALLRWIASSDQSTEMYNASTGHLCRRWAHYPQGEVH